MTAGKVTVAYVHEPTTVGYNWHRSYLKLVMHEMGRDDPSIEGELPVKYPTGGLVEARNTAVERFLESDDDWLFWIDTDMGFDGDIVERLLAVADPVDRPVIGALCFTRREVDNDGQSGKLIVPHPTIYLWAETPGGNGFVPFDDYPRNGELVKCSATGSAAVLIHRSVFDRIGGNWYGLVASPIEGVPFSEDMSFCVRCAQHDIPIYVHTGVKTNHLKEVWLSEEFFDVYGAARPLVPWVAADMVTVGVDGDKRPNRAARRRSAREASEPTGARWQLP